jgi:hypothetical protein
LVPDSCAARADGFSLHAGLVVPAGQRERLERVCRYVLRPPVAIDRLHLTDDGRVRLSLRHPWRDGTTDVVFTPLELLERLAACGEPAESAGGCNRSWAVLMQRTFGLDVLGCPRCGGRLPLMALIEQPAVITRVPGHLGLPTELPALRPARPPPDEAWFHEPAAEYETDTFTPAS